MRNIIDGYFACSCPAIQSKPDSQELSLMDNLRTPAQVQAFLDETR